MRGATRGLKISALITTLGIALSTAVLVISLSVAGGFQAAYKKSILDFNAHIVLMKDGGELSNYEELLEELKLYDGIVSAMPFIYRESMLTAKGVVKGVVIKGVDFRTIKKVSNIAIKKFNPDAEGAYLGKDLADKLGINESGDINLLIGQNKFQKVPVVGIFESGLYDYDSQFVLMKLDDLRSLFGMEDFVTGIEMKTADPETAPLLAKLLEEEYPFPYQITHWAELNRPIFEAVHLEKIMFGIIVGVLVLVGMFNIIGTLVLRIIYKAKDISILSAIGMRKYFIRRIFTFHGGMLGSAGVIIGLTIGLSGAYLIGRLKLVHIDPEIYFLSSLPIKIELPVVMAIAGMGLFLAFMVSYVAARRVGDVNIVEGLK